MIIVCCDGKVVIKYVVLVLITVRLSIDHIIWVTEMVNYGNISSRTPVTDPLSVVTLHLSAMKLSPGNHLRFLKSRWQMPYFDTSKDRVCPMSDYRPKLDSETSNPRLPKG